ncbi:MAG: acyltransferase family protein [Muribaculaceae bacterium]|nr:acyltransferase family protein [Muribaculaceae bacterium]
MAEEVAFAKRRNRIRWIDISKGLAIILMVAGHSALPAPVNSWIFTFHMPLFFFLSGMNTDWSRGNLWHFFLKKSVSLGKPFIIYSALCFTVIHVFDLGQLSWARGWGDFALWFVPVLFAALIIAKAVMLINNKWAVIGFAVALAAVSATFCRFDCHLPWNLSTAPYAAFFIIAGGLLKNHTTRLRITNILIMTVMLATTFVVSLYCHLDMARNICLPLLPVTLGAFAGIFFLDSISVLIDRHCAWLSKILASVGRETFIILSFSQIIIMALNKYFTLPSPAKYLLLALILIVLKYLKDAAVTLYNSYSK